LPRFFRSKWIATIAEIAKKSKLNSYFRSVSSVSISGDVLPFPITAMTRDIGDDGDCKH
jgi:hypothetical protein